MNDADQLLQFINEATSPFHAVAAAVRQLEGAGFEECVLGEEWELKRGHKYYVIHHGSTLIAFHIGKEDGAEEGQLRIAAAHTDFPCLRVKPQPDMKEEQYIRVNTEVYGGAILNTWLDRPLSVAGRIAVKSDDVYKPDMRLLQVKRPILIIPNLAIHLNKEINKGIELNKQTDMIPIAGMTTGMTTGMTMGMTTDMTSHMTTDMTTDITKGLTTGTTTDITTGIPTSTTTDDKSNTEESNDDALFMDFIARECGVKAEDILDFELTVYCAEEGQYVGVNNDFISAPRLDNMSSVQACLSAITEGKREDGIEVIALFDHEEIGSKTKQGAGSMLLSMVLEKVYLSLGKDHVGFTEALSKGLFLSADVGHAYHPNQKEKYDPVNRSSLNTGVCLKEAAGQSYATDAEGVAIVQQLLISEKIPYKKFVNHSNGTSGSTFGSIASTLLPMTTVDLGVPLLAMHSARELMGAKDQKSLTDLLRAFFNK